MAEARLFSEHLFPEFEGGAPDTKRYREMILSRVIESGNPDDWRRLKKLYGVEAIADYAMKSPHLDEGTLHFLASLFCIPLEAFSAWIPKELDPIHYDLIRWLLDRPSLKNYVLAGSSAIALQLEHRHSADIDLFTWEAFNKVGLMRDLGGRGLIVHNGPRSIKFMFKGIKVDLVQFEYEISASHIMVDGIRSLDLQEAAIMKLIAMGTRYQKNDYIDLYFLLERYTLAELLKLVENSVRGQSQMHYLKRILNFQLAGQDEAPVMLEPMSWETVKNGIQRKVQEYLLPESS